MAKTYCPHGCGKLYVDREHARKCLCPIFTKPQPTKRNLLSSRKSAKKSIERAVAQNENFSKVYGPPVLPVFSLLKQQPDPNCNVCAIAKKFGNVVYCVCMK